MPGQHVLSAGTPFAKQIAYYQRLQWSNICQLVQIAVTTYLNCHKCSQHPAKAEVGCYVLRGICKVKHIIFKPDEIFGVYHDYIISADDLYIGVYHDSIISADELYNCSVL